jgi:ligand-binding sensor domain-containing protein
MRRSNRGRLGWLTSAVAVFVEVVAAVSHSHAADNSLPPGRRAFRRYGEESGLLNSWVLALAQDSQGYLWVGTGEGLFRYDGRRFTRFGLNEGLPSAHVLNVACGRDGSVWAGTRTGVARWNGERFEARGPASGLPASAVDDLRLDASGTVWVALPQGLFRSLDGDRFLRAPGWPQAAATAVAVAPAGAAVIAAAGSRVGELRPDGSWAFSDLSAELDAQVVHGLAVDAQGQLWVRTKGRLLGRAPGSSAFTDYTPMLPAGEVNRGIVSTDSRGNLLVPTTRGITRHEAGTWSGIGNIAEGFASSAEAVLEDREGVLWVAGTGLYRQLGAGAWTSWGIGEGMPGSGVWGICRDRAGRTWAGTRGGLVLGSDIDWVVTPGTENVRIRTIVETPDGAIWAAGNAPWIMRMDPATGKQSRIAENPADNWGGIVWSLLVDRDGGIWAATERGLWRLHDTGQEAVFRREAMPGSTSADQFQTVRQDREGRIWAAGRGGLYCLDGGSWHRFTASEGLRDTYVSSCQPQETGEIWINYYEPLGLDLLSVAGAHVEIRRTVDMRSGLFTNKVYFVGQDSFGQLWVGLGSGVDVIMDNGIRHFGPSDGIAGEDCDTNAFLALPNGEVLLGTSIALNRFDGGQVKVSGTPPLARVTAAWLGTTRLTPNLAASVLTGRATFTAQVAGLSFVNESRVELQVRMIGLEPEWHTTRAGEVRYAALPPGRYTFELRARFGHGPWGDTAALPFEVTP